MKINLLILLVTNTILLICLFKSIYDNKRLIDNSNSIELNNKQIQDKYLLKLLKVEVELYATSYYRENDTDTNIDDIVCLYINQLHDKELENYIKIYKLEAMINAIIYKVRQSYIIKNENRVWRNKYGL